MLVPLIDKMANEIGETQIIKIAVVTTNGNNCHFSGKYQERIKAGIEIPKIVKSNSIRILLKFYPLAILYIFFHLPHLNVRNLENI